MSALNSKEITSDNFNEIYKKLAGALIDIGETSSPRGMPIKEIVGQKFILTNPLNCLCTIKDRKLNYKFAIIEKFQYLAGISDPETLLRYNKNLINYLNRDTNDFDGAYGPRIKRQIGYVYNLLKKDKDTRQAVININNESDKKDTLDFPCTVSLQFLIRKEKLNLIVNMRSNDILWGTPYDVNGFCFLQEAMASWLGIELGNYIHFNGSTHYYIDKEEAIFKIKDCKDYNEEKNLRFEDNFEDTFSNLSSFFYLEKKLNDKDGEVLEEFISLPKFYRENLLKLRNK